MEPQATILIVDDEPNNIATINNLLRHHYRVMVANSGRKALELLTRHKPPDLILLDVVMPEMDGYAVYRQIRSDPRLKELPVVFLTALAEMGDERRALEMGAQDYITKPVSPPLLLRRVENLVRLGRALKGQPVNGIDGANATWK